MSNLKTRRDKLCKRFRCFDDGKFCPLHNEKMAVTCKDCAAYCFNHEAEALETINDFIREHPIKSETTLTAHWVNPDHELICDNCDEMCGLDDDGDYDKSEFCPHCGAKMLEEKPPEPEPERPTPKLISIIDDFCKKNPKCDRMKVMTNSCVRDYGYHKDHCNHDCVGCWQGYKDPEENVGEDK